jgi:hypothetical protein
MRKMRKLMEKKIMMKKVNIYGVKRKMIGNGIIKRIKKHMKEGTLYIHTFLMLIRKEYLGQCNRKMMII